MKSNFFAFLNRMKYIARWGLMRNSRTENVQEHSLQVAMIAHGLAVIKNKYFDFYHRVVTISHNHSIHIIISIFTSSVNKDFIKNIYF